ncbi:hypothetical protein BDF19DRAFT_296282 [Syncephalis fuscata]|nr:hypothetical protein BDF19DRAFT_296282 [Syncephalis fuscata]
MQLFVGRLPKDLSSSELKDVFHKYGQLVRCDVKHGLNHCYGFVEFDNDNDAENAIRATDGMRLNGSRIAVEKSHGRVRDRDDNTCFRCGGEGHWARDCSQSGGSSRRGGGSRCGNCSRIICIDTIIYNC